MTKPIIVVKVPCKLLYVIQVKEFLIKCSTSWPYLISEFLVAYITIVASDWPRTFFTPKVFLFSILLTDNVFDVLQNMCDHTYTWTKMYFANTATVPYKICTSCNFHLYTVKMKCAYHTKWCDK